MARTGCCPILVLVTSSESFTGHGGEPEAARLERIDSGWGEAELLVFQERHVDRIALSAHHLEAGFIPPPGTFGLAE
jgi:hypothetical protein